MFSANTLLYNTPISVNIIKPASLSGYSQFSFCGKNKKDSFEKARPQATVENSIYDFSEKLYEMFKDESFSTDKLNSLIKSYTKRTRLKELTTEQNKNYSALFNYQFYFSKARNKIFDNNKTINIASNKFNKKNADFFNDIVHEMIHNLQKADPEKSDTLVFNEFVKNHPEKNKSLDLSNKLMPLTNMLFSYIVNKSYINSYLTMSLMLKHQLRIVSKQFPDEDKNLYKELCLRIILADANAEKEAYQFAAEITNKYFPKYDDSYDIDRSLFYDKIAKLSKKMLDKIK